MISQKCPVQQIFRKN